MNQEGANKLGRSITSNEIEAVIKNLPTKKSSGWMVLLLNFYKTSKEEIIPMVLILFHKMEAEGMFANSFYEASINLPP
jgi:hypothetical protein